MTVTDDKRAALTHYLFTFATADETLNKAIVATKLDQAFQHEKLEWSVLYSSPKMPHPKDVNLPGVWDRMTDQEKEILRGAHPELWLAIELLVGARHG